MPLAPGSRLGAYEIVGAIGAGGMGEVYRARDTQLGRKVAIKILPDHLFTAGAGASPSSAAERLARFQREARTLASLNHPNIAQIYGTEDRALVMELVEGEDLAAILTRGKLPLAGGGTVHVSSRGGSSPRWSRVGQTLYYRRGDEIVAAKYSTTAGRFTVEREDTLFRLAGYDLIDVAPDGRFLMAKPSFESSRLRVPGRPVRRARVVTFSGGASGNPAHSTRRARL